LKINDVLRALMEMKTLFNHFKTFVTVFQLYFSIFTSIRLKKLILKSCWRFFKNSTYCPIFQFWCG